MPAANANKSKIQIGEVMADYACGTGGFITSWLKELGKKVETVEDRAKYNNSIYGVEKKALAMGEEFAAAEDVRAFVRKNMGTIGQGYVSAAQLSADEAVVLDGPPLRKGGLGHSNIRRKTTWLRNCSVKK